MDLQMQQQEQQKQRQVQQQTLRSMFGEHGYLAKEKVMERGNFVTRYKNTKKKKRPNTRQENKELKKRKEQFIENRKEKRGTAIKYDELKELDSLLKEEYILDSWMKEKHGGLTNEAILKQMNEGDNSNFEKLDPVFRELLAAKFMHRYDRFKYDNDAAVMTDEEVKEMVDYVEKDGMFFNPLFRLGLSQKARQTEAEGRESNYRKIDNEIARRIMVKTLTHEMKGPEIQRYEAKIKSENPDMSDQSVTDMRIYHQNLDRAKRAQMAKQLLLMHMGRLKIVSKNMRDELESSKPDMPMASLLSHCSRTMIVTPDFKGDSASEDEMWDAILKHKTVENGKIVYKNMAQIRKRGSSTHSLHRRKAGQTFGKEKKKLLNLVRQTGMDVAIGGLGTSGVDGKMIDHDGSCGHVYGMRKKSLFGRNGGYIFGYESDSYGHTNQLGHTHDLKATGESASSFLGQRTDEVGEKYGGRQADISVFSKDLIITCMNKIDEAFDTKTEDELKEIVNALTGKVMSGYDFRLFLDLRLGVSSEDAENIRLMRKEVKY